MSKEIAIIIPAYNAQDYISNLMCTIQAQTYIEKCKIVIINDNDNNALYNFLYDEFSKLDIVILKTKVAQSGPGAARNIGLKYVIKQNIPYIIFADADDIFYSTMAIQMLYTTITMDSQDFVFAPFYKEDKTLEFNDDYDIWLFGKIYKTDIIKKYNILFPETYYGEDNAFNLFYQLVTQKHAKLKYPIYVWKNNENSLTNQKREAVYYEYFVNNYKEQFKLLQYLINNNIVKEEKIEKILPERVIRLYFDYNHMYIMVEAQKYLADINKIINEIYWNFLDKYWLNFTQEDWQKAWNLTGGFVENIPNIGFMDFLKILTKKEGA